LLGDRLRRRLNRILVGRRHRPDRIRTRHRPGPTRFTPIEAWVQVVRHDRLGDPPPLESFDLVHARLVLLMPLIESPQGCSLKVLTLVVVSA
jgi:hypothetical protein